MLISLIINSALKTQSLVFFGCFSEDPRSLLHLIIRPGSIWKRRSRKIDRGGIKARLKGDPITLFTIYLDVVGKERYSISDGVSSSDVSEMRFVTASRREGARETTSNEVKLSSFITYRSPRLHSLIFYQSISINLLKY